MEERNYYHGSSESEEYPGIMIRNLRKKMHLSQESMAYGICSVQKYSRIESGRDKPSELEFSGIMDRLGETGLYYNDLYSSSNNKKLTLRLQIQEEAALDNWEKVSEYLCTYSRLFPPETSEDRQFLGLYETLHCYFYNNNMDGMLLSELCHELLLLGRPEFCPENDISFIPTQCEFMLINAIAVGLSEYIDSEFYKRSRSLLLTLLILNKKRLSPVVCRNTRIALLLNLSIIETENNDYYSAEEHLNLLFRNFVYCGGSALYYRALLCKADLLDKTSRPAEASELRYSMNAVFRSESKKSTHKVLVF